jgi:hypothetical protein
MTTLSLARVAEALRRDFRTTAEQLGQESKLVTTDLPRYRNAIKVLGRCAVTVDDVYLSPTMS